MPNLSAATMWRKSNTQARRRSLTVSKRPGVERSESTEGTASNSTAYLDSKKSHVRLSPENISSAIEVSSTTSATSSLSSADRKYCETAAVLVDEFISSASSATDPLDVCGFWMDRLDEKKRGAPMKVPQEIQFSLVIEDDGSANEDQEYEKVDL